MYTSSRSRIVRFFRRQRRPRRSRELVLHLSRTRRHKNQIVQHELDALDLGLRALDGGGGLVVLRDRALDAGLRPFVVALSVGLYSIDHPRQKGAQSLSSVLLRSSQR